MNHERSPRYTPTFKKLEREGYGITIHLSGHIWGDPHIVNTMKGASVMTHATMLKMPIF